MPTWNYELTPHQLRAGCHKDASLRGKTESWPHTADVNGAFESIWIDSEVGSLQMDSKSLIKPF